MVLDQNHKIGAHCIQQGGPTISKHHPKSAPRFDDTGQKIEQDTAPSTLAMPTIARKLAARLIARRQGAREQGEKTNFSCHCLVPQNGHRRISLPAHGEIVLGRFDLKTNAVPDVDLGYCDRENCLISRNHARIVGRRDRHYIQDMNSANGTQVNGQQLASGRKAPLRPGDQITFGDVVFVYTLTPQMPLPSFTVPARAYLWVASTGNRFPLPQRGEVIVGRSDQAQYIIPDVDLSEQGEAAQVVTRRHVKIIARDGRHYVEDLGSTNRTKLNGSRIENAEFGPLNPGDHLWLGGCVLVYDMD